MLLLVAPFGVRAQQSLPITWMRGIPQASSFNPAMISESPFYIGVPGLSSHYSGVSHSGFAWNDLLRRDPAGEFYWDEANMLATLGNRNQLEGTLQHELLSFGFRSGNNFFSFSASENLMATFSYPRDLMTLLLKGNDHFRGQQQAADLSGIGLDGSHYRQMAFGYAHDWNQVLFMGIRTKLLFGLSNVSFEKSHLIMDTHHSGYDVNVNADMVLNTSLPVSFIPLDSVDSGSNAAIGAWNYLGNTRNFGFAFDMGLVYKPISKLTLGVSMIDLGHIDWRSGVENFAVNGSFEYQGVSLQELFEKENPFENLVDSINEIFNVQETTLGYRTSLPTKLNLAAGYQLDSRHHLGLLVRGTVYHQNLYPLYSLSYNYSPLKWLDFSLAWSVINNKIHNLGAGMMVNMGPVQFYVAGDNALGMLRPHAAQAASVQLGLNLLFSRHPQKDSGQSMPMW